MTNEQRAREWLNDYEHNNLEVADLAALLASRALEARKEALEEAALKLTALADDLRDEAPEAMGVAWDVVTGWIVAIRSLAAAGRPAEKEPGG